MQSLDEQRAEYRDIQDWLAGKKRAAQGRVTWRRCLQVQALKVLPKPVRQVFFMLAEHAGTLLLRVAVALLLINIGMLLTDVMMSSAVTYQPMLFPLYATLSGLITAVTHVVNTAGGSTFLVTVIAWVIAGD